MYCEIIIRNIQIINRFKIRKRYSNFKQSLTVAFLNDLVLFINWEAICQVLQPREKNYFESCSGPSPKLSKLICCSHRHLDK